jgi:hypothetical protein
MPGRAGKIEKKAWAKPELIVLVRGRPEEAVLVGCKVYMGQGGTANANYWCEVSCALCSDHVGS